MESNYDEDLNENSFFQMLQSDHSEIFQTATLEGWVICVPRTGSLPKYALTSDDFFSHILIPSDELPESHFRTLNDKEVRVCNRLVTVEQNDISRPYSTHVLFEETFYTSDYLKYKVLCVENPLEQRSDLTSSQASNVDLMSIQTLRDCIDLLWTESSSKEVLEKLDEAIQYFLSNSTNLELEPLQVQRDRVGVLYTQCLQAALRDSRLREKTSSNKHLLESVKLAVETYTHHGIYKKLMKGVTACTAYDDSHLNKTIRNLCDMQLRDLDVRPDLYEIVPRARQELARIDCYSTVLGKIGCVKRMVATISKQNIGPSSEMGNAIAADDLLPVIIFLIIKTGIPNWIAHLTYMKQFRFSASSACGADEASFLITTLEAAIEHVRSGILLGSSAPESQFMYEDTGEDENDFLDMKSPKNESSMCVAYFFDQVRQNNVGEVTNILDKNLVKDRASNSSMTSSVNIVPNLCHPLCSCDKCESLLSKGLCDTTPTIHSCNDRGFTALHVACLFGRPQLVDILVSRGADINASDYSGSTPLHYSAAKGHQNALLLLVHSAAKVNVVDNDGNTPLHLACNNGHEGCVKALLYFNEHVGVKLDLDITNNHGDTPLHHAARWGYEGIVQILTEYGASPNIQNKRLKTPIDSAHNLHILRLLNNAFNKFPDVDMFDKRRKLSSQSDDTIASTSKLSLDFDEAVSLPSPNRYSVGKDELGVRPQSTDQIKITERLLRAVAFGDTRLACYYLGIDSPNHVNGSGISETQSMCHPLCSCEKCAGKHDDDVDSTEIPHEVEREKLNCNACNSDGFTSLHVASMHGRTDLVRLLLDEGAKINIVTRSKRFTPLHLACQNQRTQVTKLLLQSGNCDLNVQDARGNTALHYACYTGNSRLVEIILKHGPRLDLSNADGKTPLQDAEEKMSLTLLRLLKGGKSIDLGTTFS